jgi:hypothetical protein
MSRRAERLHASPWQGVLYVTGGGTALLSELLTTPGASATVLEARVPYAAAAMAELLGRVPEQACSDATARALAMAAFQRAPARDRRWAAGIRPFGLACTASLATNRSKRGAHRAHVALQTETPPTPRISPSRAGATRKRRSWSSCSGTRSISPSASIWRSQRRQRP